MKKIKIIAYVIGLVVSLPIVFLVYYFDPGKVGIFPACWIYKNTGLLCPSCGITRALHNLLHLNFLLALKDNVFIIILIALVIGGNYYYIQCFIRQKKALIYLDLKVKIIIFFGIFTIIYTILRNIPILPFNYLAP